MHRERLEQEARAVARLNDPHICTLHDVGATPSGAVFLVMEFIEGNTLRSLIDRGPLDLHQLIVIGAQIADALAVAHAAGIIHGDIKPTNILLTPRGDVKILDFELARTGPAFGRRQPRISRHRISPGTIGSVRVGSR